MVKHRGHHGGEDLRMACECILPAPLALALVSLVLYLVLRPTHPLFYVQNASLLQFNFSNVTGNLTASLQVTLSSANPNDRAGVYYDRLDVFASYEYQQVTPATSLPAVYLDHREAVVWSPVQLSGADAPIVPYLADMLSLRYQRGYVFLLVKVDGRVRWKVGSFISGHYPLSARCITNLFADVPPNGTPVASAFRTKGTASSCAVDT